MTTTTVTDWLHTFSLSLFSLLHTVLWVLTLPVGGAVALHKITQELSFLLSTPHEPYSDGIKFTQGREEFTGV